MDRASLIRQKSLLEEIQFGESKPNHYVFPDVRPVPFFEALQLKPIPTQQRRMSLQPDTSDPSQRRMSIQHDNSAERLPSPIRSMKPATLEKSPSSSGGGVSSTFESSNHVQNFRLPPIIDIKYDPITVIERISTHLLIALLIV
jgi:hypothetical protein